MTPRLADLEDVVEGRKLGVEVADGHIIKCPATGKIRIGMIDDDGQPIEAKLHDVMYIPGLNRMLFSITCFAHHGHYAVFCNAATTLHFVPSWARVSLTTLHRDQAFVAHSTVTAQHEESDKKEKYHPVRTYRNKEKQIQSAYLLSSFTVGWGTASVELSLRQMSTDYGRIPLLEWLLRLVVSVVGLLPLEQQHAIRSLTVEPLILGSMSFWPYNTLSRQPA
jgi:hypothetical protein